jgi:hypothetical protein
MQNQNYSNHRKFIPLYHYVTLFLILLIFTGSLFKLCKAISHGHHYYFATLVFIISVVLLSFFFFSRVFALRAQDRAIRAEENFRHYLITGKPFDSRLTMGQIIALRFASDEELPALATRAVAEGMKKDEIKKAIKNWRADNHRV